MDPSRLLGLAFGIAASLAAVAKAKTPEPEPPAPELTPGQAMLWKYVARCALREDQALDAGGGSETARLKFRGAIGLAPEWQVGTCDHTCQEKVSSCLAALVNPTGLHVNVSLMSAAPSLADAMSPNENDRGFPYQEGAFFGNVFAGEAFVCRGRDADKGLQVKRLCALSPGLCSGIASFTHAGSCDQACEMTCTQLSDGSARCAAVRCVDPKGRTWQHPITTYLRDRIEAGNANEIHGAAVSADSGLEHIGADARAVYRAVDFGLAPGRRRAALANLGAATGGGRIEIWLSGSKRRLGVVPVRNSQGVARDVVVPIRAAGLSGAHDVELRFAGLRPGTRLNTFGLR